MAFTGTRNLQCIKCKKRKEKKDQNRQLDNQLSGDMGYVSTTYGLHRHCCQAGAQTFQIRIFTSDLDCEAL